MCYTVVMGTRITDVNIAEQLVNRVRCALSETPYADASVDYVDQGDYYDIRVSVWVPDDVAQKVARLVYPAAFLEERP